MQPNSFSILPLFPDVINFKVKVPFMIRIYSKKILMICMTAEYYFGFWGGYVLVLYFAIKCKIKL